MANDPDKLAGDLGVENTGGLLTGFLAEEAEFDRRALWRLGSWGFAAVGSVIIAIMANQTSLTWRRDQTAAQEVARQAQQIQTLAKESQNEARRLASAIETLNSDRDRLYSRVTTLELGLDSVTGALAKQSTAAAPQPAPSPPAASAEPSATQSQPPGPAPAVAPVATMPTAPAARQKPAGEAPPVMASDKPEPPAEKLPIIAADTPPALAPSADAEATKPATSLVAKSMMGPPDPAALKLIEPAKPAGFVTQGPIPEVPAAAAAGDAEGDGHGPKAEVQRTEFGVDVGGANSVAGLRALWRGLLKSRSNAPLFNLRPIIVIKEGTNGLGMQLRLVAGPLRDAGAAAKICAVLAENNRPCETAIFDGQRLTLKDEPPPAASQAKAGQHRREVPKRPTAPVAEEAPKKPETPATSSISGLFGRRDQ